MVMIWTHDATLPDGSVAVQVRVIVPVLPGPGVKTSTKIMVTTPELSVAVAVPVLAGLVSWGGGVLLQT